MKRLLLSALCTVFVMMISCNTLFATNYEFEYNGKNYVVVKEKMSWKQAAQHAKSMNGSLVEINDQGEQDAVWDAINNGANIDKNYMMALDGGGIAYVWIGATDYRTEGDWVFDGNDDGDGTPFWTGKGKAGGKAVNDAYNNWGGTSENKKNEPDDYGSGQDAAAIGLEPWPKNAGFLGKAGEWNDIDMELNELYFVVELEAAVIEKPGKAAKPEGNTELCAAQAGIQFSTAGADEAETYQWTIVPSEAGTISGDGKTATLNLSENFRGNAEISVIGVNESGNGEESEKLEIIIETEPDKLPKPTGDTQLKEGAGDTQYSVEKVEGVESYLWTLSPDDAGTITDNDNVATVKWAGKFSGEAAISVTASNRCGVAENSDALVINIEKSSSVADDKEMNMKLYPNPSTGIVYFENDALGQNEISIFDLEGRELEKENYELGRGQINIRKSGAYIIQITQNGKKMSKLIIIK
jgi:hypothetical protein